MRTKRQFLNKIFEQLSRLPQFLSYSQLIKDLQSQPSKLFKLFDSVNKICAHIALCDNLNLNSSSPLLSSSLNLEETNIVKYNRVKHYCIDGFLKDEQPCLILQRPPILLSGSYFLDLKQIVIPYQLKPSSAHKSRLSLIPIQDLSRNGNYHENCTSQELDELLNEQFSPSSTHSFVDDKQSYIQQDAEPKAQDYTNQKPRRKSLILIPNSPTIDREYSPKQRIIISKNSSPRRKRFQYNTSEFRSPEFRKTEQTRRDQLEFQKSKSQNCTSKNSYEDLGSQLRCSSRQIGWKNNNIKKSFYCSNKWLNDIKQLGLATEKPNRIHKRQNVLFNREMRQSPLKVKWNQQDLRHIRSKSLLEQECFRNRKIQDFQQNFNQQATLQLEQNSIPRSKNQIFSFRHTSSTKFPDNCSHNFFSKDPCQNRILGGMPEIQRASISKSNSQTSLQEFLKSQALKSDLLCTQSKQRNLTETEEPENEMLRTRIARKSSLNQRLYHRRSINVPNTMGISKQLMRNNIQTRQDESESKHGLMHRKGFEKGGQHPLTSNQKRWLPYYESKNMRNEGGRR